MLKFLDTLYKSQEKGAALLHIVEDSFVQTGIWFYGGFSCQLADQLTGTFNQADESLGKRGCHIAINDAVVERPRTV